MDYNAVGVVNEGAVVLSLWMSQSDTFPCFLVIKKPLDFKVTKGGFVLSNKEVLGGLVGEIELNVLSLLVVVHRVHVKISDFLKECVRHFESTTRLTKFFWRYFARASLKVAIS